MNGYSVVGFSPMAYNVLQLGVRFFLQKTDAKVLLPVVV